MFKTTNLYQNDPLWKDKPLGFSTEPMGNWGCLLTSITMMLNGLGYSETPDTVNDKLKKAGGFQEAFLIPSMISYVFPNVSYRSFQPCETSPAPIDQIDAALAAGKPVILQVDWNKQAGIQTHYVLVKERKGDDYVLYDPYKYGGDSPDKEVLLTKRYKYNGATIQSEISGVFWFDGNVPPPPPEKKTVPLPADKFVVYAIEDDLALRDQPSVGGYLWKRLKAGTELISLEAKATAQAKIGTQVWLQVQDPDGDQGYVAAWYVATDKNAQPTQPVAAAAPAQATTVSAPAKPTPVPPGALGLIPTEEVSFRTQPILSDQTLIRKVPPTETLIGLEPPKDVIAKVGIQGQWIKVKDSTGKEGYVAAWYVKYASGSTAAAAAATPAVAATTPAQPAAAAKLPTGAIGLVPTEEVSFRTQPTISADTLIRRVPVSETFIASEPANVVQSKIGVQGQWLKVKDSSGKEGYVAAWYVKYASGSAPVSSSTSTAAADGTLRVKATAEGIALRNQAYVSDATLIYRLPIDTVFTVTEPGAEGKVGINNQWLKVKDPNGTEGYIAAWFVTRA